MNLTFEQCKEVMEKVWGWSITTEQNGEEWWRDENFKMMFPNKSFGLKNVLYSWEGFGRTVEAMEKRGFMLEMFRDDYVGWLWPGDEPWKTQDGYELMTDEQIDVPNSQITATHLAALEATKND